MFQEETWKCGQTLYIRIRHFLEHVEDLTHDGGGYANDVCLWGRHFLSGCVGFLSNPLCIQQHERPQRRHMSPVFNPPHHQEAPPSLTARNNDPADLIPLQSPDRHWIAH